ncbi:MAG: DUF4870 domain-containing protein [Candidatus Eisenbacteria bacterium]|nr:DUF4870 domain-containing protein [Candidatus Eisenbacteria bacterium]
MGPDRGADPLNVLEGGERGRGASLDLLPSSRLHAALAYALAGFSGVVLLVWKREDRFVQFHCLQSIAATAVAILVWFALWLLTFFPFVGFLYGTLLYVFRVGLFVLWIYLLWQAHQGRWYRIPYLGRWAERQIL